MQRTHTVIPWDELRRVDASAVADWLHIPRAKRQGAERNKRRCVWCDSSDGLHVYPGEGRGVYCYACGKGGDACALVAAHMGVDMLEAAKHLAGWAGVHLEETSTSVGADLARAQARRAARVHRERVMKDDQGGEQEPAREKTREEKREEWRAWVQGQATPLIRRAWSSLTLGPMARDYLASRGFHPDVCRAHGFASIEPGDADRLEEVVSAEYLWGLGWPMRWVDDRPHRSKEELLVIPYHDETGALTTIRFRSLNVPMTRWRYSSLSGQATTTPFLLSPSLSLAHRTGTLYFCEGELNAMALRQIGLAAMSCAGSKTWRAEWLEGWRDIPRVILLLDDDEPGMVWGAQIFEDAERVLGGDWRAEHMQAHVLEGGDAADLLARGERRLAHTLGVQLPW